MINLYPICTPTWDGNVAVAIVTVSLPWPKHGFRKNGGVPKIHDYVNLTYDFYVFEISQKRCVKFRILKSKHEQQQPKYSNAAK